MAAGDVKRKLTAIFSADVEGYSRLMGEDELATVETLTSHKQTMGKLIRQYRGRVVDSTGDNLLAEFASVVDAVQCAVEVQQVLSSKNEALAEDRRMYFRIGINSGDVIEEGDLIYGDGVNIAARVESLAKGGGISLSGTAYDQLGKKLPLGYEYLGEQNVKNIEKPVRVYRVLTEAEAAGKVIGEKRPKTKQLRGATIGALAILILVAGALAIWHFYFRPPFEPASKEKMALPLPDKPSIAVLPFENMSGDSGQEYFADGLTEEIITALSKVPRLFVIARNSSFIYKGKPVRVQQVSEELGVQYVLEGSVRKVENRVRVTAQLVDALNGRHLWAEIYDRELEDIFTLQDQITFKIVAALQVKLTEGEQALIVARRTSNFEAYAKFLQGVEYVKQFNREGNLLARRMAKEAISLDPNYPRGYRLLATTHWLDVRLGFSKDPKQSLTDATQLYQKVIVMDPSDAVAHSFLGQVYTMMGQHENGVAEVEKAVAITPNAADAHAMYGFVLHFSGRHSEAIESTQKGIRLNPFPPNWYFAILGQAYCQAGLYKEAIAAYKVALHHRADNVPVHLCLAVAYSLSNDERNAHAETEEVLRLNPKYCLENAAKAWPYKNQADKERFINALREAGLPETPPFPLPDKPSIAVLPFVNMSGDPEQEYFSDGISEEIITALSKTPKLFVIARNSTFTYKGKPVRVQQVGRELGVRYVLEGSVRKAGDEVRITAQLVDAKTGNHLWAERYDRDLKDVFAVQDDISMKIITALQVKLTEGEQAHLYAKRTENIDAYLKCLEAREHLLGLNRDGNILARQRAEEAIVLDPGYSIVYSLLGMTHIVDIWFKWSKSPKESMVRAFEFAKKALDLDESNPGPHQILSFIYLFKRQHEKAIAECERAVALAPNNTDAINHLGQILRFSGRAKEAVPMHERAIRLNPIPPAHYLYQLGLCYIFIGEFEKAIAVCKKGLHKNPDDFVGRVTLTTAYCSLGREEEARAEAAEVLRIHPKFTVEYAAKTWPYKNETDRDLVLNALRKAGLK